MAGVEAPPLFPQPRDGDPEDVAWALSTADALWKRGEYADALSWIRRAANAAADAEEDMRTIELAKAVAELSELVAVSTPAPAVAASDSHSVDLDLEPAIEKRSDTVPAPASTAERADVATNGVAAIAAPARPGVSPPQRPRPIAPPREPTAPPQRTSAAPKAPPPARPIASRPPQSNLQRPPVHAPPRSNVVTSSG
ncbi:MAG: hypothetical protein ACHREM_31630, partial [Polyangiales bacterium]